MGSDYASRQLFCSGADPSTGRQDAIRLIRGTLLEGGYREVARADEADRSLVVGPPGRWLFIGDTAGTTRTHGRISSNRRQASTRSARTGRYGLHRVT